MSLKQKLHKITSGIESTKTESKNFYYSKLLDIEARSLENNCYFLNWVRVRVMVFNVTFNNISAISLRLVLLVEETAKHGENHRPPASHSQTLSHNVASSTARLGGVLTHNFSGDRH